MFVHEAMANALGASGVDTMFGLIGDANLFFTNAFVEAEGGRYISAVHEASAVMMAHGYACRAGRLGVATVTQGPGLTNPATALTEAVRSGTPLLLITGDTAPNNKLNQQTLEQEPFVRSTGAGYVLVERPEDAASAVRIAAGRALAESHPYVLNCPTEYQWHVVEAEADDSDPWPGREERPLVPEEVIEEAVGVMASAPRRRVG